jgi:hypothetical protein
MTEPKSKGAKADTGAGKSGSAADDVRKAFAGLPLDEKVVTLIQVELDMLGDAFNSVCSSLSKTVDEFVNACASSERSTPGSTASTDQAPTS